MSGKYLHIKNYKPSETSILHLYCQGRIESLEDFVINMDIIDNKLLVLKIPVFIGTSSSVPSKTLFLKKNIESLVEVLET